MYGFNRINIRLFTQQLRWFGGKDVEVYLWGPRIKFHNKHALWSTLDYWSNVSYLLGLLKVCGNLSEPKEVY
jgi:hypothetical protein